MDSDKYIGRLLDNRYEIQEVIGIGGMAVVYKARCHRLNRLVAIKILKDEYSRDEEFRRRFHAESQAVAMLSHPNIVSVYDVSTSTEADYIVMELIDGISLKQYMEKKGVLNWKETLHFAMQIGKALEHAHSRGIVHRDIKPHNVMVLKNGSVKVADFGIARVMSKGNTLTKEALGSVHYISPEQAKGGRVDNRSDIYSLGVVMYEMMTGRPPYDGESPVAVAIQHINGGAPLPSTLNANIPGGLEQIIMKAMAHDPADRYTTATAMLYDMDEFRKTPTILFDYNLNPVDDMTRVHAPVSVAAAAAAAVGTAGMSSAGAAGQSALRRDPQAGARPSSGRTGSQSTGTGRTGSQSTGTGRTGSQSTGTGRVGSQSARNTDARRSAAAAAAARRRKQQQEADSKNKIALIAIIACSLVAIIAIIIFLITLFGNGVAGNEYVYVPTYEGKHYDSIPATDGIVTERGSQIYSEEYEVGVVIEQYPDPGTKVAKGTKVTLTVSLGPAPENITMEDLVGIDKEQALNFLTSQGVKPLTKEEFHDMIEAGLVIRTDPEKDTPLEEGQTVYVYISKGPEVIKGSMPVVANRTEAIARQILNSQELDLDIVVEKENSDDVDEGSVIRSEPAAGEELISGQTVTLYISSGPLKAKMPSVVGKDIEVALWLLENIGFTEVEHAEYVESDLPENQVVSQSVEKDTEIPLNTVITLVLSSGPATTPTTEPTEPTTQPTEPQPVLITKTVTFTVPESVDITSNYTLTVWCDGEQLYEWEMAAGVNEKTVSISDYGEKTYTICVNGAEVGTASESFV